MTNWSCEFLISGLADFICNVLTSFCILWPVVVLCFDLLHLLQHLLCAVLLHARSTCAFRCHASRFLLTCVPSVSRRLTFFEKPILLSWWSFGDIVSCTCESLHRLSLLLTVLFADLLLFKTLRLLRKILVLALRSTSVVLLSIEQTRVRAGVCFWDLVRGVDCSPWYFISTCLFVRLMIEVDIWWGFEEIVPIGATGRCIFADEVITNKVGWSFAWCLRLRFTCTACSWLRLATWRIDTTALPTPNRVQAIGNFLDVCLLFGLVDFSLYLFYLSEHFPLVILWCLNVSLQILYLLHLFLEHFLLGT